MSQALAEKSPSNSSLLLEKLQEPPHIPGWKSRPRKKGFHWKTAWKKAGKRNFGAKNNPNKGNYPGGGDKKKTLDPTRGMGMGSGMVGEALERQFREFRGGREPAAPGARHKEPFVPPAQPRKSCFAIPRAAGK